MCGIVGVLGMGEDVTSRDEAVVEAASVKLLHRGPDGRRLLRGWRCVMANTRLAVMDPRPRASLPMATADGRLRLAYNGEIANHRALRAGLEAEGPFLTTSDSEVVLRLYERDGISAVSQLSGMFALCLEDAGAGKAYLVRDFFGITPLFYARLGRRLFFASEIKALLDLPGMKGELDEEAFHHFFSLGYIPEERTPFRRIRELRPGRLMEIDLRTGRLEERRYYRLSYRPEEGVPETEWAARVREVLADSVRRHLDADVPVGLTLSGGVDTSILLTLAKSLGRGKGMHTFSVRVADSSHDESRYQRLMSRFAQTEHHEIVVTPAEVAAHFDDHLAQLDEPNASGSALPTYLLARAARRHCKVLLSGEGGDEIFNAYETYGAWKWRRLYRSLIPGPLRAAARLAADALPVSHGKLSLDFRLKRFLNGAELGTAQAHLYWRHVLTDEDKARLMPASSRFEPSWALFQRTFESCGGADELDRLSCVDLEHFLYGDLMVKNDRMMMAHSVEARFPYLDRRVVELVARIPAAVRVKGFRRRHIQKLAMAGELPETIRRRSNFGLELPHAAWLLGPLLPFAESLLSRRRVAASGLLDPDAVAALWGQHKTRRVDHGRALWCVAQFVRWFELSVLGARPRPSEERTAAAAP